MAAKKPATIDPEKKYRIEISKSFEHGGVKYIPRAGVKHKVLGSILLEIKENVDTYEAI